ncbi:uncharacterized protein LOC123547200 isoform X1 [Mercenaria mercenaria]|uniref:uncharacterized protein LOC123547200 isoform X1 n=1 Tax=Mercenaria mercenaria TaxID=6596 RepID=UPI00234F18CB|nr:uncharacterized protein LOC123547200 isoform X1 [Mercenaria mercenaria]
MSDDCLSTNMAAVTVIVPKQRAKMFSIREIDVITEFMKTHLSTLRASHTQGGPGAAQRQAKLWEKVTAEINACGNGPRTVKQVKEKWRNMVKMAKTDVSAERTSMRKTGGGPPRPEMSQTSQTVASLYESSASFHGVCSDADTLINVSGCTDVDIGQQVVDHLDLLSWDQQDTETETSESADTTTRNIFSVAAALCNINQPTGTEAARQADTVPEGVSIQPDYPEDSCVPCANRSTVTTQKQSSSTSYQQKKAVITKEH